MKWIKKVINGDEQKPQPKTKQSIKAIKVKVNFDKHKQQIEMIKGPYQNIYLDSQNQFYQQKQDSFDQKNVQDCSQIVDNLVKMSNLIKIIQNIPDLKGQYITLKIINKILLEEDPDKSKLINYILSKTSLQPSSYLQNSTKAKQQSRVMKKLLKKSFAQQIQRQNEKQKNITKFYYKTFSNGLVYQYYPLRALIWKIVSNYLPSNQRKWIWKMEVTLINYRQKIKQFIIQTKLKKIKSTQKIDQNKKINNVSKQNSFNLDKKPSKQIKSNQNSAQKNQQLLFQNNPKDHPLNSKQNSKWKTYFQDFQLWNIIQRDTARTRPNQNFFKQQNIFLLTNDNIINQSDPIKIELKNNEKVQFRPNDLHLSKTSKQKTTYADALTRIIFIYLKVHPEQKYYQGINQLAAIIYFSFTNKNSEYFRRVSESDSYQIFENLMQNLNQSPLRNPLNKKLPPFNHFLSGQKYFVYLKNMIKKYDFRLFDYLQKVNGFDQLKAITMRWFMTIFLNEFSLDQSLILWDPIMVLIGNNCIKNNKNQVKQNDLSGIKLTQFILYMALAVIHLNRNQICQQNKQDEIPTQQTNKILFLFQKIKQRPVQIVEKTIYLLKSFPKLLD